MLFTFDLLPGFRTRRAAQSSRAALAHVRACLALWAEESDARLRERAAALRQECRHGNLRPDFSADAIALIAASIDRTHGLAAYDVQLLAGLALADGALAEMATGEGKTLAALFPSF